MSEKSDSDSSCILAFYEFLSIQLLQNFKDRPKPCAHPEMGFRMKTRSRVEGRRNMDNDLLITHLPSPVKCQANGDIRSLILGGVSLDPVEKMIELLNVLHVTSDITLKFCRIVGISQSPCEKLKLLVVLIGDRQISRISSNHSQGIDQPAKKHVRPQQSVIFIGCQNF